MTRDPVHGEATTTAVLAIDRVHLLPRVVGKRQLRSEVAPDEAGRPRVNFQTPTWEDFVRIACNEMRSCVAEIGKRDRTIDRHYPLPGDLELARIADSQGLGGSSGARGGIPG
jgi:hypothetical protein